MLEGNGVSGTGCQKAEATFVVDVNCQFAVVKLLGQENCRMSGETKEAESGGTCASTRNIVVKTHKATPKVFRFGNTARG